MIVDDIDLSIGVKTRLEASAATRKVVFAILLLMAPVMAVLILNKLEIDLLFLLHPKQININELPLIMSSNNNFKVAPEDPGGLEIKNSDQEVYKNIVSTSDYRATKSEEQKQLDAKIEEILKQDLFGSEKVDKNIGTAAPQPTQATQPVAKTVAKADAKIPTGLNRALVNNIKDEQKQHKPANIVAQIVAFSTLEKTNSYKNYLLARYPELFTNIDFSISRGKDDKNGDIYRLRLINFRSREEADTFCRKYLVATGKTGRKCIVMQL